MSGSAPAAYRTRLATPEDAEVLAEARFRQLLDEGSEPRFDVHAETVDFFRRHIADGSYQAYITEADGALAATAAVLFQEYPPSISWHGSRRGYVTSVYTAPAHRGRGLATALVRRIVDDARALGLGNLWRLASREGRSVYKRAGFEDERPFGDVYMEWYE